MYQAGKLTLLRSQLRTRKNLSKRPQVIVISLFLDDGFLITNEKGSTEPLKAYRKKDIVLTLPGGKTLRNVKWVSVWWDASLIYNTVALLDVQRSACCTWRKRSLVAVLWQHLSDRNGFKLNLDCQVGNVLGDNMLEATSRQAPYVSQLYCPLIR